MAGNWARSPAIRFYVNGPSVAPELSTELEAVPGIKVAKKCILAPDNAAWLVESMLAARGIAAKRWDPPRPAPRGAGGAVPWLHPMVVEPGFLTSYQREGIATALRWPNESGLMVWSAGAGKTLGAICLAATRGPSVTVVVTKAAIRPTWIREITTYTRGVEWRELVGESPTEADLASFPPDRPIFLITGYDTLPAWITRLEALHPRSVILDEVHRAKSSKRWEAITTWEADGEASGVIAIPLTPPKPEFRIKDNQSAACYRLSRAATHRLGLTATPIRDRVRDLWAQLDLVRPWDFGGFWSFAKRYCAARENPFGGMDTRGSSNLAELKRRLSYVCHNVPHALANRSLPPVRRLVTRIPLSQQNRPSAIKVELRGAMKRGQDAVREALLMEAASRKRKVIADHTCDAIDGALKICIFTGRRVDVESLAAEIHKKRPGCPIWTGTGADSVDDRDAVRVAFMDSPGPAVFVATGESMGEGLDMQDCDLGILAMIPYTPGQVVQYEGRWVRLGMKRPCLIRYFIAEGTIDEHMSAILLDKLPAIEKTVDLDEIRGLTSELRGDEGELLKSMAMKVLGG